jgi:hypothetical protein
VRKNRLPKVGSVPKVKRRKARSGLWAINWSARFFLYQ